MRWGWVGVFIAPGYRHFRPAGRWLRGTCLLWGHGSSSHYRVTVTPPTTGSQLLPPKGHCSSYHRVTAPPPTTGSLLLPPQGHCSSSSSHRVHCSSSSYHRVTAPPPPPPTGFTAPPPPTTGSLLLLLPQGHCSSYHRVTAPVLLLLPQGHCYFLPPQGHCYFLHSMTISFMKQIIMHSSEAFNKTLL